MARNAHTAENGERDLKRELIAQAVRNKGVGVKDTPDPTTAARHREFMKTKKFTHGDYEG